MGSSIIIVPLLSLLSDSSSSTFFMSTDAAVYSVVRYILFHIVFITHCIIVNIHHRWCGVSCCQIYLISCCFNYSLHYCEYTLHRHINVTWITTLRGFYVLYIVTCHIRRMTFRHWSCQHVKSSVCVVKWLFFFNYHVSFGTSFYSIWCVIFACFELKIKLWLVSICDGAIQHRFGKSPLLRLWWLFNAFF